MVESTERLVHIMCSCGLAKNLVGKKEQAKNKKAKVRIEPTSTEELKLDTCNHGECTLEQKKKWGVLEFCRIIP